MSSDKAVPSKAKVGYNRFLLLVAGLGGLLYGVDVGIISGALPYLQATFKDAATGSLTAEQSSFIVAAVLLGGAISTLFAGMLADLVGRKKMMILSGLLFVASIPMIALAHGYWPLVFGRLLQGISGGLIGVVIPLYLAECLSASDRGKGTGFFQLLLVFGFVAAALIATYFSIQVDAVKALNDPQKFFDVQDHAWRSIFWVSLPPGILFIIGSFMVAESPRWLFRRGCKDAALVALLRSRTEAQAQTELREMEETVAAERIATSATGQKIKDSLLSRKYVIPFLLACVILACNQATGINSIIGYNTTILIQAGLSDKHAHWGSLCFNFINFLATIGAVILVDRKGRKFLLSLGSAGIIVSLVCAGIIFQKTEKQRVDVKDAVQALVMAEQKVVLTFDQATADQLLASVGDAGKAASGKPATMVVIYSAGDYVAASKVVRSDDPAATLEITRESCLPSSKVESFFKNPFANLDAATNAPLKIQNALITPVPSEQNGWLTAACLFIFMAFYAVGPGVCVWLALSELMPTRIRSNGMSIALMINIAVSTTIATLFLPAVGAHGYATMFFIFAGCTVVYFITAFFFLPETKGKTLEEIEEYFEGGKKQRD
jgi:MFS transporter, SP family, solute carrier family 2 (myo-inositol transporter), member 13